MQKPIYEIFDSIRSGEMGDSQMHKFIMDYSNNYDIEILKLLLRDLEFYFFMEKEEKESEFSWDEKEKKIKELEEKNKEIPVYPSFKGAIELTQKQFEAKEKLKKTGWDFDKMPPNIDWEKILYPFEFFCLYQFERLLKNKIVEVNEKSLNENRTVVTNIFEIPENEYSGKNELSPKEKLIVLDKLGIVELLRQKLNFNDNATHLAEILGAITGIDNTKGTLTGYCNYLTRSDHSNKNSPYSSENTVNKAMQIYNTFKLKDKTN
ncbi:hypothetical protein FNJ88_08505 [Chryseobacterium sp. SNU WT5]|uniref:hypothetical protein n=1 Tax=Chryseobacterium sp. SNU WT5 TaxID=2594269 RepID=UPI00117C3232|nr:hypothetical protein [Chryseobacterium sp. SNU WT5]QDP85602.1 hypothetical protein FNJ88_08505 [Chryseobacterium sp. SNU WT5]